MKILNQHLIKSVNLKRIYALISDNEGVSRAQLAGMAKLSKTTVSALVDELITSGYVLDDGIGTSANLGRKPNMLLLNSKKNFVVVISWQKRQFVCALVDTLGMIAYKSEIPYQENVDYVYQIKKLMEELLLPHAQDARILGVCIIIPAMIDDQSKEIVSTVLHLKEADLVVDRLRSAMGNYPLSILNDTACYAYAEYICSDIEQKNVAFININKGVGAVLFNRGEMLRGANAMSTQFGHYSINRDGKLCTCGNRGCLEGLIGETALASRAAEFGVLSSFENTDKILFRDVGRLCQAGDEGALLLARRHSEDLAYGLSNLISMFHPQLIIIGGMGIKLGALYLEMLIAKLKSQGFSRFVQDVEVRFTNLDDSSELQGAARYFMDKHFKFDGNMENKLFLY